MQFNQKITFQKRGARFGIKQLNFRALNVAEKEGTT